MNRSARDYDRLWAHESNDNTDSMILTSEMVAQTWSGFPKDPTRPTAHSIKMDLEDFNYPKKVFPVKPTKARRGRGYANLSNYNTIP